MVAWFGLPLLLLLLFAWEVRLVLLVGVEGSGHHLVASIVQKAHQQHVHLKEWAPEVWLSESGACVYVCLLGAAPFALGVTPTRVQLQER